MSILVPGDRPYPTEIGSRIGISSRAAAQCRYVARRALRLLVPRAGRGAHPTSAAPARRPAARAGVAGSRPLHDVAAGVAEGRVSALDARLLSRPSRTWRRRGQSGVTAEPEALPLLGDRPAALEVVQPRQRRLGPLTGREDAKLEALVVGEVVDGEAPEDVVDQARGETEIRVVGDAGRLEAHVRVLPHEGRERHAVLETEAHRDREGIHDARQRRALLGDLHEDLAGPAVLVLADGDVALAVGDAEGERVRPPATREPGPRRRSRCGDVGLLERTLELCDPCHEL